MSANLDSYIGRQDAWHRMGTVTGKYVTWQEACDNGLDYEVFKSPLHDGLGRVVPAWGTFRWDRKDKEAGDKAAAIFLGSVGQDYKVIPHKDGFGIVDALMEATDGAHYETAGSLGRGEVVWGLADLNLGMSIGEDKHESYLLFYTSHDGSKGFGFRITNVRVVCQNTLDAALSRKTETSFRVRHTKNAQVKVMEAKVALENLSVDVKGMEEKLKFLASRKVKREHVDAVMERLFPKTQKEKEGEAIEVSSTRRDNILMEILSIYEKNDGDAFPEQRGTAYNLLNAVTNYVDHERASTNNGKGRSESALFGSGMVLKNKAMEVLIEQAGNMGPIYTTQESNGGLLNSILAEHH